RSSRRPLGGRPPPPAPLGSVGARLAALRAPGATERLRRRARRHLRRVHDLALVEPHPLVGPARRRKAMSAPLVTRLKALLLHGLSRVTNRHAVLLPAEAGRDDALIDLRAPYRVAGSLLTVDLRETGAGRLSATLLGYEGHFPVRLLWAGEPREYPGPCALTLDLVSGTVRLGGAEWGKVPLPLPGRRFCWRLRLAAPDGHVRERLTGHYVPLDLSAVGREYFEGENYVDHEAQSAADHREIVRLLRAHGARGPALEIGCATRGLLPALAP